MQRTEIDLCLQEILHRRLPDGGFAEQKGVSRYRPDATAWVIMALRAANREPELVSAAQTRLADGQAKDGRVALAESHPDAIWPTALAVLAWRESARHHDPLERAAAFLLQTQSKLIRKNAELPIKHDPEIPGWPWINHTFG